ncbi:HEAT repeat domain-containing protein [Elusimicrobiota bacterium]
MNPTFNPIYRKAALLCALGLLASPSFGMARRPPEGRERDSGGSAISSKSSLTDSDLGKIRKNIEALQKDPEATRVSLSAAFADRTKGQEFRGDCASLLWKLPIEPASKEFLMIERVLRDRREHTIARIEAAGILLRSAGQLPASTKKAIRDLAVNEFSNDEYLPFVLSRMFYRLGGDADAERFLVEELEANRSAQRNNRIVAALGRMDSTRAIRPISRLLLCEGCPQQLYRTRGYLALGGIGGEESYDVLVRCLEIERDKRERRVILEAIGATKDPRAKDFLLEKLQHPEQQAGSYYAAVLDGLRHLGDPDVVPTLKRELDGLPGAIEYGSRRKWLQRTIRAIQDGADEYPW